MAFNKFQFKDFIQRTLRELQLFSPSAVQLLLGTAAQESSFGTYLKQMGNGPALGAFEMEPTTFYDLVGHYGSQFPIIQTFTFKQLEVFKKPVRGMHPAHPAIRRAKR